MAAKDKEKVASATVTSVQVISMHRKMRNPHTGALFYPDRLTDVVDLNGDENFWVRSQIEAGVLKVYEPPVVEPVEEEPVEEVADA